MAEKEGKLGAVTFFLAKNSNWKIAKKLIDVELVVEKERWSVGTMKKELKWEAIKRKKKRVGGVMGGREKEKKNVARVMGRNRKIEVISGASVYSNLQKIILNN